MDLKKIDYYKEIYEQNINLLRCPICKSKLKALSHSLNCIKGHAFDLSAKGSVNLLYPPKKPESGGGMYSAELWAHREAVFNAGFFCLLTAEVVSIIAESKLRDFALADLGCGEGSFLRDVAVLTGAKISIGIDISKEAINRAASKPAFPAMWLVANSAALPIADNCLDVAITMLSPSNYAECRRVVKKGGLLIKILPGKNYLAELRTAIFKDKRRADYDNVKTTDLFKKIFPSACERDVAYLFQEEPNLLESIFAMTPLSAGQSFPKECLNNTAAISADFKILYAIL